MKSKKDVADSARLVTESSSNVENVAEQRLFRRPQWVRVVLPAYNEEDALPILLEGIQETLALYHYEVVIVDDGSIDRTSEIAAQASFHMPIRLIEHTQNQGLGTTIKTGLFAAISESQDHDIILSMDADNTHPPGLIPRMVQLINEGYDVVIASRFQRGARVIGVPRSRVFLTLGARLLFSTCFPSKGLRDYTSGFRAYRAGTLRQAREFYGDQLVSETGFSCMTDILLKLRRRGAIVSEAPLLLRYDQKQGLSKMKIGKTVIDTLRVLVRQRLRPSKVDPK